MRYGSVCSGIEAATVAWHPLGWKPAFFSEIEAFPRAVLQNHYDNTPLHGDFTTIGASDYGTIDLLVGGTPCQSFSVAGLRKGLDDERGNLALEYLKLAQRKRPAWLVWENVPGVLSSSGGRDFGAFLGGLGELGYGFAYRVLDAQYFGVAQRRRRVFVVGHLGDWRPAAAVLFERHSLQGHPAPRREAGKGFAGYTASSFGQYRAGCGTLRSEGGDIGPGSETLVAHTLRAEYGASEDGTGRGTPIVTVLSSGQANAELSEELSPALNCNRDGAPIAFGWQNSASQGDSVSDSVTPTLDKSKTPAVAFQPRFARNGRGAPSEIAYPLTAEAGKTGKGDSAQCVAFAQNQRDEVRTMAVAGALAAEPGAKQQTYAMQNMSVRRLTPVECERLQGFPDGYTAIPWRGKPLNQCPDGPRYKALGNSMAVPCMRWIGERIQAVQDILDLSKSRPATPASSAVNGVADGSRTR